MNPSKDKNIDLSENKINELRFKIDQIDEQLVQLINQRAEYVIEIGKFKQSEESPLYRPVREQRIYQKLAKINKGPFSTNSFQSVFREIMSGSISLEGSISVAYLGPEASYTHMAAKNKFGDSIKLVPLYSIPEIFEEVAHGNYTYGIVPVENSNEGMVTHTLDEFIGSDLLIYAELFLNVSHCLLSLSANANKIKRIFSHSQSFGQCKHWLRENYSGIELIETASNAKAAILASKDKSAAAIASSIASDLYGLKIISKNIQDLKNNVTRFLVIGEDMNPPSGKDKTTILCSIKDKPGTLYELIEPFYRFNINMTKIESRPTKKKLWEYNFFIDFEGHFKDKKIGEVTDVLKSRTIMLKILGSYPKGQEFE